MALWISAQNFRRDPQLAPNFADVLSDVANLPVSRAELRRQKQQAFAVGKDNRSSTFTTPGSISSRTGGGFGAVLPPPATNPNDATTTKKLLWAKAIASKAQGENTNIAKRMGKMEELEKGIALLEKIREVIGKESYVEKVVKSVFASFPAVFNTFDACVDIVDVDADEDCTDNIKEFDEDTSGSVVLLTPTTVPRYDSIEEEAVVAATGDDNNVISEEEPSGCYDNIVTHTLLTVIDFAALNANNGDFTDKEWAAYLKIRMVQERRERENENEALTPPIRQKNLAL